MARQWQREQFVISTDRDRLDTGWIHATLTRSHWAAGIDRETVERAIRGSLCFAMYDMSVEKPETGRQIAFARVISDYATFAYLSDVFMEESYRGRGLMVWLMDVIFSHPELQGLRRFALVTTHARAFYEKCGFTSLHHPERWLERYVPDIYAR